MFKIRGWERYRFLLDFEHRQVWLSVMLLVQGLKLDVLTACSSNAASGSPRTQASR